MLKMTSRSNLGSNFKPPPSYSMLQYESFYHLGMALQNVGRHTEAVQAYNHAMWSMDLKKVTFGINLQLIISMSWRVDVQLDADPWLASILLCLQNDLSLLLNSMRCQKRFETSIKRLSSTIKTPTCIVLGVPGSYRVLSSITNL